MAFCVSIKELRERLELSQMDFAKRLGVKTGTVAEWESGESEPTLNQLAKISAEFNVSLDELISENKKTETTATFMQETVLSKNSEYVAEKDNKEINSENSKNELIKKEKSKQKKHLRIFIVAIIVALCIAAGVVAFILVKKPLFSNDTNAISKAEASVVKVYCYDYNGKESCTGSGFLAFDSQTIVTNYHVASEGYTIKVATGNEVNYDVESVITYNIDKDIAILKLKKATDEEPLILGNSDELKKGENVTAIGSPLGIKNSISTGVFSGRIPSKDSELLQFTASISPGSSGGALFNDKGEVVGVTSASYEDGQNLNLAIPVNIVLEIYDNKNIPTKTDVIYTRKYPYINYLKESKETSIKEINSNPKYNYGRCLIKQVYISSYNGSTLENSTEAFLTDDVSLVSGDFNYDKKTKNDSTFFLEWNINGESLAYCDEFLKSGSLVDAIVDYWYSEDYNLTGCEGIALISASNQ